MTLLRELLPHQQQEFDRLDSYIKHRNHIPHKVLLYLTAGAGKTELTQHIIKKLMCDTTKVVVLCPPSLLERNEWGSASVCISLSSFLGTEKGGTPCNMRLQNYIKKVKKDYKPNPNLDDYESFREVLFQLGGIGKNDEYVLVIDEAHTNGLKAPSDSYESPRFRVKKIIANSKHTLMLTGTPYGRGDFDYYNLTRLAFDIYTDKGKEDFKNNVVYNFYKIISNKRWRTEILGNIQEIRKVANKKENSKRLLEMFPEEYKKGIIFILEKYLLKKSTHSKELWGIFSSVLLKTVHNMARSSVICPYSTMGVYDDGEFATVSLVAPKLFMEDVTANNIYLDKVKNEATKRFNERMGKNVKAWGALKKEYANSVMAMLDNTVIALRLSELDIPEEIVDYSNFEVEEKEVVVELDEDDDANRNRLFNKPRITIKAELNSLFLEHKLKVLEELLKAHPEEQFIVWTTHTEQYKKCMDILPNKFDIHPYNDNNLKLFREGKIRGMFTKVGSNKEGHTWIEATVSVFLAPLTGSQDFSQASKRILRVGQKNKVYFYILSFRINQMSRKGLAFLFKEGSTSMLKRFKSNQKIIAKR